ncbi:stage II sporulation protein R [Aquibacillus kalidii]|uniref:stage II sporulation protein R n=1 Tax=Aquibacillus kalidii TaxID=2762597 RepID=UPI001646CED4|nr:stage II sporulation protein R [Aquibacillus kalidii]
MKKLIFIFFIFLLLFGSFPAKGFSQGDQQEQISTDYQVIPDEAIRLRILANSDKEADQDLKRTIRDEVNKQITEWVKDIDDIKEARKLIQKNIQEIEGIVGQTLEAEGSEQSFNVKYGKDVKFPTKVYGSYVYPSGEYEAILVTLGEGKGANWWCVLFPPLCFLDFSNGTSVADGEEKNDKDTKKEEKKEDKKEKEVEFKFFFLEWFS